MPFWLLAPGSSLLVAAGFEMGYNGRLLCWMATEVGTMVEELTLLSKDEARTLLPRPSHDDTPRERRYYVWTVGCQMNVSDSERLESALQGVGYAPADQPEDASFI